MSKADSEMRVFWQAVIAGVSLLALGSTMRAVRSFRAGTLDRERLIEAIVVIALLVAYAFAVYFYKIRGKGRSG